jgi:hypothetical protein
VCLAWIIRFRLLGSPSAYSGEGKAEPVAASSAEGSVPVVHRWFIRVLEAENGVSWSKPARDVPTPPCIDGGRKNPHLRSIEEIASVC